MARTGKSKRGSGGGALETAHDSHTGSKRTNIPPAKIAGEGKVPAVPKAVYRYSPHLPPALRFDPTGEADRLPELIEAAGKRLLNEKEQKQLAEALRSHEPWLEWAQKREQHERGFFKVDPVALHIHERVSAEAIVRLAMREDVQRDLFADPQQPYQQAVQFYKHDVAWANRLILGDSLQVMSSLARRENLAGKVQMIYMDPPYGIKFRSNFQPRIKKGEVTDKEKDLTREPETVRAYRDTWTLGTHSYLSYFRERLLVSRELLADDGSIFVQISDDNLHVVRNLLDEVFSPLNFVCQIQVQKTGSQTGDFLVQNSDYVLWFAKDKDLAKKRYHQIYLVRDRSKLRTDAQGDNTDSDDVDGGEESTLGWSPDPMTSDGFRETTTVSFQFQGRRLHPGEERHWKVDLAGMERAAHAERIAIMRNMIRLKKYYSDFPVTPLGPTWDDVGGARGKKFVVQTTPKVIERCMCMTTVPGDLVLDPTCGGGTTAHVAEQWGRRWIVIDTSRVAISIARQRIVTAKFEHYETKGKNGSATNPGTGFVYKTVPHITLKSIAQNTNLDPIFARHQPLLDGAFAACNKALKFVGADARMRFKEKLADRQRREGKRSVTDADRRRWDLPVNRFEHWTIPFDTDSDWPVALKEAVTAYRRAWRAKMDEVNTCIERNAEPEELVDKPEVIPNVVRVSGPFTVEGVRPEELSLGDEGLFDGTPNEFEDTFSNTAAGGPSVARDRNTPAYGAAETQNLHAYLDRMVHLLRQDGVTFLGNKQKKFSRLEPLYEASTGTVIHGEGAWEDDDSQSNHVAIGFGPQYGPVTAQQVEDLIRASRRYTDLVVAGFSFDGEACAVIQEQSHPRLRIHQAYIRPDVNPGMDGLLKDTPNSQLFSVFGQPDIALRKTKEGWVCELVGVDIYDPISNAVRSTGADKVAAWFLDSDFDGRCFCITQAFFPDRDAWDKIANALKARADEEAFAKFAGTISLPFDAGRHRRIAVKVIDPRGNEVMAIKPLKD